MPETKCPSCGKTINENELKVFDGWGAYCKYCCDQCASCNQYFPPNTLTVWGDALWCEECLAKEAERIEEECWEGQWKGK